MQTAHRTRQLHRLTGYEPLLSELDGPVLDLVDASRAAMAGDIRGAVSVVTGAAAAVMGSASTAAQPQRVAAVGGVAGDIMVESTHQGLWSDAAELSRLVGDLVPAAERVNLQDGDFSRLLRGLEFDRLGAAALIEHHTGRATELRPPALVALETALQTPRSRRSLGQEYGYALLALGSVLNGRRELGPAAVALARAVELIPRDRSGLATWVRAELALVRIRQARWDDARHLSDALTELAERSSVPSSVGTASALRAVLAALDGRFSAARELGHAADAAVPRTVITSVLVSHTRIISAIGRNNWPDLQHALDDLEHQGHRSVFDTHEWHALSCLALWHLERMSDYRARHTAWGAVAGARDQAYWWAHAAIIARLDGELQDASDHTQRALALLDDDYDPLGRTWVRILAGTHVSLLDDPVEGLTHYEDARTELLALGANAFAALCTSIIRSTSDELARTRLHDPMAALTAQQRAVAQLVARGYTSTEIGELLHLSRKTIDFHVANILIRLDLRTRREISRAIEPPAATAP